MVTPCGFESHLSHQKKPRVIGSGLFLVRAAGLERPALRSRAKKCPGDTFLGRGRVPGNRMAVPKDRQAISVISVHVPTGEGSHFILRQQYFIRHSPWPPESITAPWGPFVQMICSANWKLSVGM